MEKIKLNSKQYKDKLLGCWYGKNIGGTLGTPYEGQKYVHNLTFYNPVPEKPLPNDDLDFQLVWLKMLEDRGVNLTFKDFTDYWMKYLAKHWYNEYSLCTYNLKRGLMPPVSGAFQNYWVDEMGSPIRSEIWACVAPADPQLAVQMAWMDSSLDHTGGEGRWGEMFWAAAESAAFVIDDPKTLINIGLSMIPISCNISRVISEAVRCYEDGIKWDEARERIATIFGHHQPCNAIPNHGFAIIGLLYGKDFGDRLCKAANCAYDTDCTAATLGSLQGIMHGASAIPKEWMKPVGDLIIPCKQTVTDGLPKTIGELTERTEKVAGKFVSDRSDVTVFGDKTSVPEDILSSLFSNEKVRELLAFDNHCAVENTGDIEVIFHYGGEPVLYPGARKCFEVSLGKRGKTAGSVVELKAPGGWKVSVPAAEEDKWKFDIFAKDVKNQNTVEVVVKNNNKTHRVEFTVLGPEGIKRIPAAMSAPEEGKCL
ncbi:MAG: hypothetical protein AUJ85_05555 [Elusimicrobia bacterium CG1_02_37_114]|nr:MAG: hypothetical protein AUJ85_05555 [Elusimicrobia bacterium CG1_02_37_114]PIV53240.1 MAG: hypothetical protein COS17_04925 [Elusimicrobia bacterium CG02_land_8_20_14_3_00_37_13]PIZ12538.1 MAG: hypothetical protein COY53_09500 [Elusimicrobia bacterium CG_4_10_14_0_8_um_filter_37_32]